MQLHNLVKNLTLHDLPYPPIPPDQRRALLVLVPVAVVDRLHAAVLVIQQSLGQRVVNPDGGPSRPRRAAKVVEVEAVYSLQLFQPHHRLIQTHQRLAAPAARKHEH